MTSDAIQRLRSLAPPGSHKSPGSGSFLLACGTFTNATERNVTLRKSRGRIYKEVWETLFEQLGDKLGAVIPIARDPLEDRFYTALLSTSAKLGGSWPSDFRNLVNYGPGFGYAAIRREPALGTFGFLRAVLAAGVEPMVDAIEDAAARIGTRRMSSEVASDLFAALSLVVIGLSLIARELHAEVISRNALDARWMNARARVMRDAGVGIGFWPTID